MRTVSTAATNDQLANTLLPNVARPFVLNDASEYYDRGWSVIPLKGKRPAVETWRKFQSQRATLATLQKWFAAGDINVGIVTGELSGLVVVDCDTPEDARYWQQSFPTSPLKVRTGGGGEHFYYRYPKAETITNRVHLLSRQIDLRAEGGYVVAPPSLHQSGRLYEWERAGNYCLADAPFFSTKWIDENQVKVAIQRSVRHPRAYLRSIYAVSGKRGHNQTFRAACVLRDAGLSPEEALCELILWNETNASPQWTVRELLHKVQSAFQTRVVQDGGKSNE